MGLRLGTRLPWLAVLGVHLCIGLTAAPIAQAISPVECVRGVLSKLLGKPQVGERGALSHANPDQ